MLRSTNIGRAIFATVIALSLMPLRASAAQVTSWQALARAAGNSEDNRDAVIARLKRVPDLNSKLRRALKTDDRPLAIEAIAALDARSFVSDMIDLLPSDEDGFLTVGLNAMMETSNRVRITSRYLELLPHAAPCAAVAMLEPLGRLGVRIPRSTLLTLDSQSPEVRSSLLYYLRIMALHSHSKSDLDLVTAMTRAPQEQLRLQALSVASELRVLPGAVVKR